MGIGQAAPSFAAFGIARGAAVTVFEILARKSAIDALSDEGLYMHTLPLCII